MYDPQDLLLYYDDATQWPAVYKTGMVSLSFEIDSIAVIVFFRNY